MRSHARAERVQTSLRRDGRVPVSRQTRPHPLHTSPLSREQLLPSWRLRNPRQSRRSRRDRSPGGNSPECESGATRRESTPRQTAASLIEDSASVNSHSPPRTANALFFFFEVGKRALMACICAVCSLGRPGACLAAYPPTALERPPTELPRAEYFARTWTKDSFHQAPWAIQDAVCTEEELVDADVGVNLPKAARSASQDTLGLQSHAAICQHRAGACPQVEAPDVNRQRIQTWGAALLQSQGWMDGETEFPYGTHAPQPLSGP